MARVIKNPIVRKSEIVREAKEICQRDGFEKLTMQAIMKNLKIAKGTIYHYFTSKESLVEAVIDKIVNELIANVELIVNKTKGSALKKIETIVRSARESTTHPVLDELHKKGNEAMHTRLLVASIRRQAPIYAKLIKEGCDEGIFTTEYPLECAEFILSAMQFLTDMGIYPWADEDLARRTKSFPEIIERLLEAPKGSFKFLI